MHAVIHHHHHVALKGAISTASAGVPAPTRRWNPYTQLITPSSTPSSTPPSSDHAVNRPTNSNSPFSNQSTSAEAHPPHAITAPHATLLPHQVIRRDERTRHAGSLVDSAVQLLSEIWPQSPNNHAVSFSDSAVRPIRQGSFSALNTLPPKSRTDSLSVPFRPLSPLSPMNVRRSNSLPTGQWPSAGPEVQFSQQPSPPLAPSSIPASTSPPPVVPSPSQIPLKTFVYEVLRRSRTSMSVLQAGLCYLEGARSKVEQLRQDAHMDELRRRELEQLRRQATLQGDGIIDWSGNGIAFVPPYKRESADSLDPTDKGNPCGYFAIVEKLETEFDQPSTDSCESLTDEPSSYPQTSHYPTPPITELPSSGSDEIYTEMTPNSSPSVHGSPTVPTADKNPLKQSPLPSPLLDPRRTFLASLLLASKFLQDRAYSNKAWSKLSGLEPREIGRCERALGDALGWRLWVGKEDGSGVDSYCGGSSLASPFALAVSACPAGRIVRATHSESDLRARKKADARILQKRIVDSSPSCKRGLGSDASSLSHTKGVTNALGKTPTHVVAAECRASADCRVPNATVAKHLTISPAISLRNTPASSFGSSPPSSCYSATPASSCGINTPTNDCNSSFPSQIRVIGSTFASAPNRSIFATPASISPACSVGRMNPTIGAWVNELHLAGQSYGNNEISNDLMLSNHTVSSIISPGRYVGNGLTQVSECGSKGDPLGPFGNTMEEIIGPA